MPQPSTRALHSDAPVVLDAGRLRISEWLHTYFGWMALAHKVAETMPTAMVGDFDEERATTICDVLKVRYGMRERDVEMLVSDHPALLGYSLQHQIIPALNVLDRTLGVPELLRNRMLLRVPQMLSNDLQSEGVRPQLARAAQRVLHLSRPELDALMVMVPAHGEPLRRPNMNP